MRSPGWILLAALSGCSPAVEEAADETAPDDARRYARSVCDWAATCDCGAELLDGCEAHAIRAFERADAALGTAFDRGCFESVMESLEDPPTSCGAWETLDDCLVFEGTRLNQSACELQHFHPDTFPVGWTDCRTPGSACIGGTCRVGLNILEEGARCGLDVPNTCGPEFYCGLDGTCQPARAIGESCDSPRACSGGDDAGGYGYCRGVARPGDTGVCTPYIEVGQPCERGEIESCGIAGPVFCGSSGRCEERRLACALGYAYDDVYYRHVWEVGGG